MSIKIMFNFSTKCKSVLIFFFLIYFYPILLVPKEIAKFRDWASYAEGEGKNLFSKIDGDQNTIMGLPVDQIKQYIESL